MNPSAEIGGPCVPSSNGDQSGATYSRLRELIVRGQLAPGSRIIETEISERLGVSPTPVRSALQRLQQEGFVEQHGSGGGRSRPKVAALTRSDAYELMYLLGSLEGLAARRTAELEDDRRQQIVDELRTLNRRMEREAESGTGNATRFFDIDAEFHCGFVKAGGGDRLLRLHGSYRSQAEWYFRYYVGLETYSLDRSVAEHEAMIEAIATGDPDVAEEAVERNWRNAEERLEGVIAVAGERGDW